VSAIQYGQSAQERTNESSVLVWDWGVRVFHWGLAVCVGICAYTGFLGPRNWLNVHLVVGVMIAALVAFRVVWGWFGSTYARFESFAISPSAMKRHVREIALGQCRRIHLGHNPLGAAMIYAMLVVLFLLVASGVVALGGALKQGPLAFTLAFANGSLARQIHELLAIALLFMILAHLAGVAFESWWTSEDLVRAMVTGRKREISSGSVQSNRARPWGAAAVMVIIAAAVTPGVILLSNLPARGVPQGPLDPTYARECGSCHFAYPPSLAPSGTWTAVMGGLRDHFGENASLDAGTTVQLREWLVDNAGEHWDTRAANMFSRVSPTEPLRITATPAWLWFHQDLPDKIFTSPAIGAKGACGACHQDAATARFDPQQIAIPKETKP